MPNIHKAIAKVAAYSVNRDFALNVFDYDLLSVLTQVKVDNTKLDTLQFGYWMQLQKQNNRSAVQGIQNLNNETQTNSIAFDTNAWMTQWGVDATIQKANYNYHVGLSLGQTQGRVLAHNEETEVSSNTKGRTLGLYAVSMASGETLAVSIQKGWFDHQSDEGNYDSDTLITKFMMAYPLAFSNQVFYQ